MGAGERGRVDESHWTHQESAWRQGGDLRDFTGGPSSTERASVLQCPHGGYLEALLKAEALSWQNAAFHRARPTLGHPYILWDSW